MAKEKVEKEERDLDQTIAFLQKKGIKVAQLGDNATSKIDVIPSGSVMLNLATGVGGYPKGKVIEIFGPEMSGKTTLALIAIAQAQKAGKKAAFIDVEHAFSPVWGKKLGVDVAKLYFNQPDYGEQALDTLIALVESKAFDIVVLDSIASLLPKAELDGEIEDQQMGLQARMVGKALRKLTPIASKNGCTVICINQIRDKIGVMFGNPETTPGGKALKFYSTIRIRVNIVSKSAVVDGAGGKIAHKVNAYILKNKVAPPFREAEFLLNFQTGVDNDNEIFEGSLASGIVSLEGRTYTFGKWSASGRDNFANLIKSDADLKAGLMEALEKIPDSIPTVIQNTNEEDELELDTAPKKKGKKIFIKKGE